MDKKAGNIICYSVYVSPLTWEGKDLKKTHNSLKEVDLLHKVYHCKRRKFKRQSTLDSQKPQILNL